MEKVYQKRWGLFHNPDVRKRIDSLDEVKDCQEIAKLLYLYEYSFDFVRALEVALLYTYGSRSVSKLLDKTNEFEANGQKRYDDTAILVSLFVESGWDGDFGRRAIERVNKSHSHYKIPNDDFLYVLWTFIHFPIEWSLTHGRRKMTQKEQNAWCNFWLGIGERMGMTHLPANKAEFDAFVVDYEARELIYDAANKNVTDATIAIMANWFPKFVRPIITPISLALMPDKFVTAVGHEVPSKPIKAVTNGALKVVAGLNRVFAIGSYPTLVTNRRDLTYRNKFNMDDLRPDKLKKAEDNKEKAQKSA